MPRMARLKVEGGCGWYHLYCRAAGKKDEYPMDSALCRRKMIELLKQLSSVYCCKIAGFSIMGNHYHVVAYFEAPRRLSKKELYARALRLYPTGKDMLRGWLRDKWDRFAERIFDVSEFMRSLQSAFARWFNRNHGRRGRFWGDRFKSTLLEDLKEVRECMLYIELNPVRAGIVDKPEEYEGSSLYLREIGKDRWLLRLSELGGAKRRKAAVADYKAQVYYRGNVRTGPKQAEIPNRLLTEQERQGFASRGIYAKRLRYFVDGLALGSEGYIRDKISELRERGIYQRRKNPIIQESGWQVSLREQRPRVAVV